MAWFGKLAPEAGCRGVSFRYPLRQELPDITVGVMFQLKGYP